MGAQEHPASCFWTDAAPQPGQLLLFEMRLRRTLPGRQSNEQLPIIMVTASGAKDTAIKAISLGAQAILLKPFDVEELQQVIQSCFRVGT